jgi:hypothetical protein
MVDFVAGLDWRQRYPLLSAAPKKTTQLPPIRMDSHYTRMWVCQAKICRKSGKRRSKVVSSGILTLLPLVARPLHDVLIARPPCQAADPSSRPENLFQPTSEKTSFLDRLRLLKDSLPHPCGQDSIQLVDPNNVR